MSKSVFLERLENPPKPYRPIPFWSWNEKLEEAETRRQIAEMDRVGIGGYFMHARGGLQTQYMGPEWMGNIAASVDEGRQRGMGAWAYDENGWPSGFGSGKVNGKGLKYQQKYLRWEAGDEPVSAPEREIAVCELADGRRVRFYYDVNPFYVDTLDAAVVADFLEEIYEPYARQFGDDFGGAMPGFFTDEPQVSRDGIPWSFVLPEAYEAACGEDLLSVLPGLFFEEGNWQRTRYRFWHRVQELFVTAFSEQIYNWCETRGCALTGHMVLEETLHSQLTSNGAVMPHYEFFHMPGMDWLGRHIEPPTTPLQVASVAHQLGLPQVMSETFALTGWNVSFTELKWMFEWQMVRGVTLLCQHLEGYSLRGIRKRDYPPSLFYQQPWWDQYRFFNDAVSRLGMLLSDGEARFDVLVLHPQSSAWLDYDDDANGAIDERFQGFLDVTRALEQAHVPMDYGDERILQRHATVESPVEGAAESAVESAVEGGSLRVGQCRYRVVVVPPVTTLAASTARLLCDFAETGGQLIWAGAAPPALIEGETNPLTRRLAAAGRQVADAAALVEALPESVRRIRVRAANGSEVGQITATERHFDEGPSGEPCRMIYLVNSDLERGCETRISLPGARVCRLVVESGETAPVPAECDAGRVTVPWTFPPAGSLALFAGDTASTDTASTDTASSDTGSTDAAAAASASVRDAAAPRHPLTAAELGGPWDLTLDDPNALTLDTCDITFDGELVARNEHISTVQHRALELERPVDIGLRFQVEAVEGWTPPDDCHLVVERPERFTVTVNGEALAIEDAGWYWDRSFRRVPLGEALRAGANEIVLQTRFEQPEEVYQNLRRARRFEAEKNKLTYDSEIEAIYLTGSFGVETPGDFEPLPRGAMRYGGPFRLCDAPASADPADLTTQGLPFFAGTATLRRTVQLSTADAAGRCFAFGDLKGHVLSLAVNGRDVTTWFWRPYEADLEGLLQEGENTLELRLTGGLRNLLGPHHLEEGESYGVGPGTFFKEPNVWGNAPWNDGYCFVQFGVKL